jgi:hypothetical protein
MPAQYKGVREGASVIIPRLYCEDVEAQIEFCCEALGGPKRASSTCDVAIRPSDAHDRS